MQGTPRRTQAARLPSSEHGGRGPGHREEPGRGAGGVWESLTQPRGPLDSRCLGTLIAPGGRERSVLCAFKIKVRRPCTVTWPEGQRSSCDEPWWL